MDVLLPKYVARAILRICFAIVPPPRRHRHHTLLMYNAGLPAGIQELNFEFPASSETFDCDEVEGGCPGTYGMKLSVCELECEDTKHAGHAGALAAAAHPAASVSLFAIAVLDVDDSLTFTIPENSQ
jgi:hypothetical protein